MHIKRTKNKLFNVNWIIVLLLCITTSANAQVVWENHTKEIYSYLSRMAQKGLIDFNDNIRPLSRKYLADCLDSLAIKKTQLSIVEEKELNFYKKEYGIELASNLNDAPEQIQLFKLDPYNRWRMLSAKGKNSIFQLDPVVSQSSIQGSGKNVKQTSYGINYWGNIGKHWGFQFFFNDFQESGNGFDTTRQNSPETGIVRKDTSNHKSQNFTQFRGSISYSWKNGSISFGQDHLLWGYGQNGKIVLSDKAPAFPFIRFDYQLFSWLKFNYSHIWLNSSIIDSNKTYQTGSGIFNGQRIFYIQKFLATHGLQIKVMKGLDLSLGESILYSDRLEVGYLFPLMFFKVYDNIINNSNINAGSNGQFFFQISSRNQLPKTHLYSTLFVDEIRISTLLDKAKSRNQLGYTLGGSVTDVVIPYLTIGLEYTRVNPFVYRNLIPAQNYTSYNYYLGDWMGNNFDRLTYTLQYTPIPRLKCLISYQTSQKGGAGTIAQQYFQEPQPRFLFDPQNSQKEITAKFSYELINNLKIHAFYNSLSISNKISLQKTNQDTFNIGFEYGL